MASAEVVVDWPYRFALLSLPRSFLKESAEWCCTCPETSHNNRLLIVRRQLQIIQSDDATSSTSDPYLHHTGLDRDCDFLTNLEPNKVPRALSEPRRSYRLGMNGDSRMDAEWVTYHQESPSQQLRREDQLCLLQLFVRWQYCNVLA